MIPPVFYRPVLVVQPRGVSKTWDRAGIGVYLFLGVRDGVRVKVVVDTNPNRNNPNANPNQTLTLTRDIQQHLFKKNDTPRRRLRVLLTLQPRSEFTASRLGRAVLFQLSSNRAAVN